MNEELITNENVMETVEVNKGTNSKDVFVTLAKIGTAILVGVVFDKYYQKWRKARRNKKIEESKVVETTDNVTDFVDVQSDEID